MRRIAMRPSEASVVTSSGRPQDVGAGARVSSASRRGISSRSERRSTIMSIAPFSSRNSARWNPSGSFSPHRLLDDARTGEADQRAGLGDHEVGDEREDDAETPPIVGSVEQRDERKPRLGELLQRGGRLRHLEQRIHALLHPRAAGGGDADERHAVLVGDAHAPDETLADDRPHRATHEFELERRDDERHARDASLHHDERVGLAGLLERGGEALRVLLLVLRT